MHEFVFGDDLFLVAHQHQENLESLRRKRYGLVPAKQEFLLRIDSEGTELVELLRPLVCA